MAAPRAQANPQLPYREPADVLVIFGITGDLAKKMTFKALYRLEARKRLDCRIVGVAINDWGDEELRDHARESISSSVVDIEIDEKVVERLVKRLTYVAGDYKDAETFKRVAKAIAGHDHPVFYLEIPPSLFADVVGGLGEAGITDNARVVIEKPFGHDLASARALQAKLLEVLEEPQILRIDHYLGKEPVMDINYLRFANTLFEPVWNRRYVSHVQMTVAEDFGVADRGQFYDSVGTLRDVVQNHMLQMLALIAMEPPAGNQADPVRDKKLDLFKAVRAVEPDRCVRGQYDGYLDVEDVATDSRTETYAALELVIDNWRWADVPFFLRAGKCLPVKESEINVVFKRPPRLGVGRGEHPLPNQIAIRVEPEPGARVRILTKEAGEEALETTDLQVLFERVPGSEPEPYERLLDDALRGDSELFTREDAIEETWRIVQPVLDDPGPVHPYDQGTWGPKDADRLVKGLCEWYEPWLPSGSDGA